MYQELQRKVTEERPSYSQEEIHWLLKHLGDPSPEIRDDLVFISLARGIQEELFTEKQFHFIAEDILSADGNEQSLFYKGLNTDIRNIMLDQGLYYLKKEKDTTGFSSQYGWIHAFAHGADLLTEVVCHPEFPKNRVHEGIDILDQLFKRISIRFTNDEDWRLARVLYEPISQGKLEQEQVVSWIKAIDFPLEETEDFYKFSNFRSCLLEVYVQLDQRNILQNELRKAIQSFQY